MKIENLYNVIKENKNIGKVSYLTLDNGLTLIDLNVDSVGISFKTFTELQIYLDKFEIVLDPIAEILKETEEYRLSRKGNVYTLSFFDERISNPKYNINKKVKQSRVTKNPEVIKDYR